MQFLAVLPADKAPATAHLRVGLQDRAHPLMVVALCIATAVGGLAPRAFALSQNPTAASPKVIVDRYCVACHNNRNKANAGQLALDGIDLADVGSNGAVLEKMVRKLRSGVMPPTGRPRPDKPTSDALIRSLETVLDQHAAMSPNPGRTESLHRLNRAEYRNAVKDLLAVEIDLADLLPTDDVSYGFDNMAGALKMNDAVMDRYLAAANAVSRAAMGAAPSSPIADIFRVSPSRSQTWQLPELPFGTRGGLLIHYTFPVDAEYSFRIDVSALENNQRALNPEPHDLEISIDGERARLFAVAPAGKVANETGAEGAHTFLDAVLAVRAGQRRVAVTFVRKPYAAQAEGHRRLFLRTPSYPEGTPMPRYEPWVSSVSITGPFGSAGPGQSASRTRILTCRPKAVAGEVPCAKRIVAQLARRAYRRDVTAEDLAMPLKFFQEERSNGGFEKGIEAAVRTLLVAPEFLFRVETDPADVAPGAAYRTGDFELASRLSFFLWSSIPDDELLDLAGAGRLRRPAVLEAQVRRMLADSRSVALVTNFAGQWLQLRNLAAVEPSPRMFPDFDDTLRDSMRLETELLFQSILVEDRSISELLTANYTFLNERLARHYQIPGIQGSHFRRVELPSRSPRRGLLGQASVLTVTSHADRTSPVLRGKWILENILGTPPPLPPANVPPLENSATVAKTMTMRERMAAHRKSAICASCHSLIDPPGFALEQFDAIGQWRDYDESSTRIDPAGALPDGRKFAGVSDLRDALAAAPLPFAALVTERLLTYALGRGLDAVDMPTVRRILADAESKDYRLSQLVLGIVNSLPFQYRRAL